MKSILSIIALFMLLSGSYLGLTQASETKVEATTTDALSVRNAPGIAYNKLGTLPADTRILMTATNANRMWLQFDYSNRIAWICAAFTTILGDLNSLPVSDNSSQDCDGNDTPFTESFIGKLRAECLDRYLYASAAEAQQLLEEWRHEYNDERPHSSLGYLSPSTFAANLNSTLAPTGT